MIKQIVIQCEMKLRKTKLSNQIFKEDVCIYIHD